MIDVIFGNALASLLVYVPYALLYILAFRKNLRFSLRSTLIIVIVTAVVRDFLIQCARATSAQAVIIYNYVDIVIVLLCGILIVKSSAGRMLFVGLVLKNTADAIVIFAKYAEYLVNPQWAAMGYHWSYSVSLIVIELLLLPSVYSIVSRYFTHEIRESIAHRWFYLWVVPFFFYLTWLYIFYYPNDKTDLQLACTPLCSLFLLLSISCQYLIYVCLASLVVSLQNEAILKDENHAIQLQVMQSGYIRDQINEDRRLRHDLHHHFTTIASLVENQEYTRLSEYVSEYITPVLQRSRIHYSANTFLNIMACYYANKCAENHIETNIRLNVPESLPLADNEITVLFGNLLENAYEACLRIPPEQKRKLSFRADVINHALLFSIENSCREDIRRTEDGVFLSSKHSGAGTGVASCESIVKKHGGSIDYLVSDHCTVNLYFPAVCPNAGDAT